MNKNEDDMSNVMIYGMQEEDIYRNSYEKIA